VRAESALIKKIIFEIENIAKFLPRFLKMLHGLVARIAAFHPAGPGSIPGVGELFFSFFS
jgi:hypothetical protein